MIVDNCVMSTENKKTKTFWVGQFLSFLNVAIKGNLIDCDKHSLHKTPKWLIFQGIKNRVIGKSSAVRIVLKEFRSRNTKSSTVIRSYRRPIESSNYSSFICGKVTHNILFFFTFYALQNSHAVKLSIAQRRLTAHWIKFLLVNCWYDENKFRENSLLHLIMNRLNQFHSFILVQHINTVGSYYVDYCTPPLHPKMYEDCSVILNDWQFLNHYLDLLKRQSRKYQL